MDRQVHPELVWPWEPRKKCVATGLLGTFLGPLSVSMVTVDPISAASPNSFAIREIVDREMAVMRQDYRIEIEATETAVE